MRWPLHIAASLLLLSTSACFTGVESTPKITDSEVRRRQVTVTPEERFLADVAREKLSQWKSGKQFFVADSKIRVALEAGAEAYPEAGQIIEFQSAKPVVSMTDIPDTELTFRSESGHEVRYRIAASPEEVAQRSGVDIPFTIEMSVVEQVRQAMMGRDFFIRTSSWFTPEGNARAGLKYVPVRVVDVVPGNAVYPVAVQFHADVLGEPDSACVYMAVDERIKSTRDFPSLFNFTDPHLRYPTITPDNWAKIQRGRVALDMTREECRLALGQPMTIDRGSGPNQAHEMWSYDNGVYLIFDNGLLRQFRN